MNLTDAEIAALDSGAVRKGVFFRMGTTPIVRLWLGFGKIEPGVNAIDLAGAEYKGYGEIAQVPEVSRLINGEAERVTFTLSGISEEIVRLATVEDSDNVRGADVALGFALFPHNSWASLLGPIKWVSRYTADVLGIEEQLTENPEDPVIRIVKLSVGSAATGRWRPPLSYWTNPDQQRRSPGDRFCERTNLYTLEWPKVWPDF